MAKILQKVFASNDQVSQSFTVQSWHVSQSVDAFTGASDYDITISGSLTVIGPTIGSFTGSLLGTSSWADNAITASYILNAVSSSFSSTASYVENAQTASYVLNAVSSSFSSTASFVNPLNQNVILTGSLNTSGSVILQGLTTESKSFLVTIDNTTGQLYYTSSAAATSNTTPSLPFNSFQYNNAGAFAGSNALTFVSSNAIRATGSFTGSFNGAFIGNLTGNATNLSTNRTNWATNGTITAVVGQLAWRHFGNGHTIFDASNGLSPDGTAVNNTNPSQPWEATRPTLMGWNGTDTFGVRVDLSRYAESIKNTGTVTLASPIENNEITITQPTIVINTPVKLLNFRWYSDTWSIGNVRSNTATSLGLGIFLNSTEVGRFTSTDFKMFNRDVIAYAASDKRLKDNITPISNPIEKIQKIGGYEFDWIPTEDIHSYEGHDIGVVAQEIEEVLPELVTTRDNGYKAVKYDKIVALLIEAIKDQQKQIEELKSKIG
jgi:hypothetical protein